ncbi:uncharacterized protein BDV17DRAFT_294053 [Aspergillus undulatus]|uniref:uncharacterized protein n=1 Tax=Aspergillus undulatus TaxID=1810928 RepID=UPI003CCDBF32
MWSLQQINIRFIGLGAMGLGMATDLQRRGQYSVTGFDIWKPSLEKFVANGGRSGESPADVAKTSQFPICMAATAQQLDFILFDSSNAAIEVLPRDATVILCSTVPRTYYDTLPSRIAGLGRPDIEIVDAPVSGALARATDLLGDMSEKLYIMSGGLGAGSKINMVNQLLVGTHIAVASGSSWTWNNRVPHILESDWTPLSALSIFVKDMGIVVSTSRTVQFPLPIASVAEQPCISGSAKGYGKQDDAGLVRLFFQVTDKNTGCASFQDEDEHLVYPRPESPPSKIRKVALIGLDGLSCQMALLFAGSGFEVHVFDADGASQEKPLSTSRDIFAHDTYATEAPPKRLMHNNVILRVRNRYLKSLPLFLTLKNTHVFNTIRRVTGSAGAASTVKLMYQHQTGIQVRAASEAMSFAAKLGLDTRHLYELVGSAAAWSWMSQSRAPKMLRGDWSATSDSVRTLANDLRLFLGEAKESMIWAPLASAALNLFLAAVMKEWAGLSDAGVVRLYETEKISVSRAASTTLQA